jgi:hypothetical protein
METTPRGGLRMETSDVLESADMAAEEEAAAADGPPDPAGIVRGMATVLLLWGLGFLCARLLLHLGDWATVVGVLCCAAAGPLSAVHRRAPV